MQKPKKIILIQCKMKEKNLFFSTKCIIKKYFLVKIQENNFFFSAKYKKKNFFLVQNARKNFFFQCIMH